MESHCNLHFWNKYYQSTNANEFAVKRESLQTLTSLWTRLIESVSIETMERMIKVLKGEENQYVWWQKIWLLAVNCMKMLVYKYKQNGNFLSKKMSNSQN